MSRRSDEDLPTSSGDGGRASGPSPKKRRRHHRRSRASPYREQASSPQARSVSYNDPGITSGEEPAPAMTIQASDPVPGPFSTPTQAVAPLNSSDQSIFECWRDNRYYKEDFLPAKHEEALRFMKVSSLGGEAQGRYLRWELLDRGIWTSLQLQSPYSNHAEAVPLDGNFPLFVEIRQGGPVGEYITRLVKDKRRARGLFVQLYGVPNEVPCRSCDKYIRESDSSKYAGMRPFFGCRSIPDTFDGICGNCYYHIKDHNCSFRETMYSGLAARDDREPPLIEELTLDNSPVLTEVEGEALVRLGREVIKGRSDL
ncbi:hypothetical protein Hte_006913 [Hypoxylon texense]